MQKLIVFLMAGLMLAGCGLSRKQVTESNQISHDVFSQRISTPEFRAVVSSEANHEAGKVMRANFAPMWTDEFKTQPIVKQTVIATMAVPLAVIAAVSYDLQTLEIPVFFTLDSYVLDSAGRQQLQAKADILNANHKVVITIVGRASGKGGIEHNTQLSKLRAEMCQQYLLAQNVNPNRILVTYRGESDAVAEGLHEDQRADFTALIVKDGLGINPPPEGPGPPGQPKIITRPESKPVPPVTPKG